MTNQEVIFKKYLKSRGLKFTPERRNVLEGVVSILGHFDADRLYEKLHRRYKALSLATIYRTLPHLIASGLIREVLRSGSRLQYEKSFGYPHHDHLLCIKCGKILEFEDDEIERLQNSVCRRHNFKSIEYRLGIRGYCKVCQSKIKS